jgi:hypothetical protein
LVVTPMLFPFQTGHVCATGLRYGLQHKRVVE